MCTATVVSVFFLLLLLFFLSRTHVRMLIGRLKIALPRACEMDTWNFCQVIFSYSPPTIILEYYTGQVHIPKPCVEFLVSYLYRIVFDVIKKKYLYNKIHDIQRQWTDRRRVYDIIVLLFYKS